MSEDFGGIHGHLASWETILRWRNRWEYCLGWTPVEDDSLHLGEILPPRRAGCEKTWFQTVSRKLMSSGRGDHRWCPPHHDPARRNMRFRRTLDSTVKREYPQHRNFPLGGSHAAMHSPQRSKRPGRESCQSTCTAGKHQNSRRGAAKRGQDVQPGFNHRLCFLTLSIAALERQAGRSPKDNHVTIERTSQIDTLSSESPHDLRKPQQWHTKSSTH